MSKHPLILSVLIFEQWMLQNYCSFSPDYNTLLRRLKDPLELRGSECVIQFPYALPVAEAEKTEEELARIAERKREQGKRLQELAAKNRLEKASSAIHYFEYHH
jgi:actin-related protein 5